jgi:hypothetical protein
MVIWKMPKTSFKLIFETEEPGIDIEIFQKSLPNSIRVYRDKNDIYLEADTSKNEDITAKYLVERELDRVFFLTFVKIKAAMVKKRVRGYVSQVYSIYGDLPPDIEPQKWTYELPIMLKLWSMASDLKDEFILQILYYYQIIELAYPTNNSFPEYKESSTPPEPLTECKLIRHLVIHSGEPKRKELKLYCKYLRLPEVMHDITDDAYSSIMETKVKLMEEQAKKVIQQYLQPPASDGSRNSSTPVSRNDIRNR